MMTKTKMMKKKIWNLSTPETKRRNGSLGEIFKGFNVNIKDCTNVTFKIEYEKEDKPVTKQQKPEFYKGTRFKTPKRLLVEKSEIKPVNEDNNDQKLDKKSEIKSAEKEEIADELDEANTGLYHPFNIKELHEQQIWLQ